MTVVSAWLFVGLVFVVLWGFFRLLVFSLRLIDEAIWRETMRETAHDVGSWKQGETIGDGGLAMSEPGNALAQPALGEAD
jgi:hypothetical protein